MMKMFTLCCLLFCVTLTTGCNSGSSSSGGKGTKVAYTVDCSTGVTCSNTSDISEYNSGSYHSVTCYWHCAYYKDRKKVYVALTFDKSGSSCWEFDREFVTSGICD